MQLAGELWRVATGKWQGASTSARCLARARGIQLKINDSEVNVSAE